MEIKPSYSARLPLFPGRRLYRDENNSQFRVRASDSLGQLTAPGLIPRMASVPEHQSGHVPSEGAFEKRLRYIVARYSDKLRLPLLRLLSQVTDTFRIVVIVWLLDMNDEAVRLQALCEASALGNEPLLRFCRANAHHESFSCWPDRLD